MLLFDFIYHIFFARSILFCALKNLYTIQWCPLIMMAPMQKWKSVNKRVLMVLPISMSVHEMQ